jgi:hypothetical protein
MEEYGTISLSDELDEKLAVIPIGLNYYEVS